MSGQQRRRVLLLGGGNRWQLLRLAVMAPLAALVGAILLLTLFCRSLLGAAAEGTAIDGDHTLLVATAGFLLISAAVVVLQAAHVAHRVAGPEYRLVRALRRIRGGDISFRVNLRKGDLLGDLSDECNELLEWLNHNPPSGVLTGTDLVELEQELQEPPEPGLEHGVEPVAVLQVQGTSAP